MYSLKLSCYGAKLHKSWVSLVYYIIFKSLSNKSVKLIYFFFYEQKIVIFFRLERIVKKISLLITMFIASVFNRPIYRQSHL